jgi:molybdate transport system substrate-binding protein
MEAVAGRFKPVAAIAFAASAAAILGLWAPGAATFAAAPAEVHVAVAANFTAPLAELGRGFERAGGGKLVVSAGSTGKLYEQIRAGAPFEILLAADAARPERLESEGLAVPGSRFTYARGRLVLWSPRPDLVDAEGAVLARGGFAHLAIANPKTAPYGAAAEQTLRALGLWERLEPRLVIGEDIAQAHQFVASGSAELGFVALAQLHGAAGGSRWVVPASRHAPIDQQAVLLRQGRDNPAARALLDYLRGAPARQIIASYGYEVP